MRSNNSLVTIGVASYNNSQFILDTLNSINAQTYENIELIIVDDYSTDNSVEIINQWIPVCKYPVKFIVNSENLRIPKVCNIILQSASAFSKFLVLFGSDDIMQPDRISKQVYCFENSPDTVACVLSNMTLIDEKGGIIIDSFFDSLSETKNSISNTLNLSKLKLIEFILKKNILPAPTLSYRIGVLKLLGGWDESLFFEDLDMNLRLLNNDFKFLYCDEKLVSYRRVQTSVTQRPNVQFTESILLIYEKYRSLSKEIDSIIDSKIKDLSLFLYELDSTNSAKWLFKRLKIELSLNNLVLVILARLNVKYEFYQKILKILNPVHKIKFQIRRLAKGVLTISKSVIIKNANLLN